MKMTITGSELESRMKPLRAQVRNSEGINYDRTEVAVYEEDGCMLLTAMTQQPTYEVYMELNLSGNPDDADAPGMKPIDVDACASRFSECWTLRNSALAALNRSIGQSLATYEMVEDKLKIRLGETSEISFSAVHNNEGITVPVHSSLVDEDYITVSGVMDACRLQEALLVPLNVCALGMQAGHMKERAIHLHLGYESLSIEALSATVQVASECNDAVFMEDKFESMQNEHFAISLPAARILYEILIHDGGEVSWVYSADRRVLTLWFGSYVMAIDTVDMREYQCELICSSGNGFSVSRKELWNVLRRAKATGDDLVMLSCNGSRVTIYSNDGNMVADLNVKVVGQGFKECVYRLPIKTLQTLLRGCVESDVYFSHVKGERIVVELGHDVVALVRDI